LRLQINRIHGQTKDFLSLVLNPIGQSELQVGRVGLKPTTMELREFESSFATVSDTQTSLGVLFGAYLLHQIRAEQSLAINDFQDS
jgi:hypothetical protein